MKYRVNARYGFKDSFVEIDFSGKKVRKNGVVLDKHSLCYLMEHVCYKKFGLYTIYAYDVCIYEEIKNDFLKYCKENCEKID